MTRKTWIWIAAGLTAAALAATFVIEPGSRRLIATVAAPPAPTPIGWIAQLELIAGDGVRGLRD
ncbi:hypothetical protein AB4084_22680, partial [Lysobacter sp. 2RAB21]